ncbi:lysophospholipid acyltransferase family protein [Acidobacteriota bacterium]
MTKPSFEEELQKNLPIIRRLNNLFLFSKKIIIKGHENFIKKGPNIIVGNHIGSFKDISTMFEIIPRAIFFTANQAIFDKDEFDDLIRDYLRNQLKNFGLFLDFVFSPIKSRFVNYVSTNIARVGSIPVDLSNRKSLALKICQDYLRDGKAIVTLQGRGRIGKNIPNPYVSPFRRGPSLLSYKLYKDEDICIPVTPIAIFGTHMPVIVPGKIKVNVGEPMYVTDYLADGSKESMDNFTQAMEKKMNSLILELIRS